MGMYILILGVSLFLSTLYLFLKDLVHLWTVVLLVGFWTVPIIWDYHYALEDYAFMSYNPITAYIIAIRQVTLHNETPDIHMLGIALIVSLIIFGLGYWYMNVKSKKAVEIL